MNFLAHYLLATRLLPPSKPLSLYVVGTALPDLLPLAAPRKRLRLSMFSDSTAPLPGTQAVTDGARAHLLTDAAFHKTLAFQSAQSEVSNLVTQAGFVGIRVRRFFLSHVLVELALDAVLLRRDPSLVEAFYEAFTKADFHRISRWAELTVDQPLPALPNVLTEFVRSRYLRSYSEDAGVAEGLNRLSLRARQDAFRGDNHARLIDLVSDAITTLTGRADGLLSETTAGVVGSYPPTTEK